MQELGLYLMYDMRWIYTNLTGVQEEVERIKNRPNLLLWYTADEPDGWVDPQNATLLAYEKIYDLDKGYHPVSLVLNCQDYFFEEYTRGADIVMEDVYTIGNNVTFSSQWGTVCTPDVSLCMLILFGTDDFAVWRLRMRQLQGRVRGYIDATGRVPGTVCRTRPGAAEDGMGRTAGVRE